MRTLISTKRFGIAGLFLASVMVTASACAPAAKDNSANSTGGSTGSGGSGSGGNSGGSGGSASGGSGGGTASGGASGSGGGTASGGASGSGGATASGGAPGTGGTTPKPDAGGTGGTTGVADAAVETAPVAATFTTVYSNVIEVYCKDCHEAGNKPRFTSKAIAFTSMMSRVVAGNPTGSKFYQLITSTNAAMRMPKDQPALAAPMVDQVRAWIMAGAMNN